MGSNININEDDLEIGEKPQDLTQYTDWLESEHGISIGEREKNHYSVSSEKIKKDFENSKAWKEIINNLKNYDDKYYQKYGYNLLDDVNPPEIYIKDFDSFYVKTYRKNVLDNKNWPNAPDEGWITPDNWLSRISDIIRLLFVVKYLDGVKYIADNIIEECNEDNFRYDINYEAKDEGYYAAHINLYRKFSIYSIDLETEEIDFSIEIQITTQLQELIRKLLHKHYEIKRIGCYKNPEEKMNWKWDYECDEFATNYLGHILHYIEGMIMDIRKKEGNNG